MRGGGDSGVMFELLEDEGCSLDDGRGAEGPSPPCTASSTSDNRVDLKLCELQLGESSNKDVREPLAGAFGREEALLPLNDDGGGWCM